MRDLGLDQQLPEHLRTAIEEETLQALRRDHLRIRLDRRSLLGEGGSAVVFRAEDSKRNGAPYAVKIYLDADDASIQRLWEREELHGRDSELPASVVRTYATRDGRDRETGRSLHQPYAVLELIDGVPIVDHAIDLQSAAKAGGRGDRLLDARVAVCRRLLLTVQDLHDRGFVHADLSPNNVMVQRGSDLRIIDIGTLRRSTKLREKLQGQPGPFTPGFGTSEDPRDERYDTRSAVAICCAVMMGRSELPHPDKHPNEASYHRALDAELRRAAVPSRLRRILIDKLHFHGALRMSGVPGGLKGEAGIEAAGYDSCREVIEAIDGWQRAKALRATALRWAPLGLLIIALWFGGRHLLLRKEVRQMSMLVDRTASRVVSHEYAGFPAVQEKVEPALRARESLTNLLSAGHYRSALELSHRVAASLRAAEQLQIQLARVSPRALHLGTRLEGASWVEQVPAIQEGLRRLRLRYQQVRDRIREGKVVGLSDELFDLDRELSVLEQKNGRAGQALDARSAWSRRLGVVAPRVRQLDGFERIEAIAQRASRQFRDGTFVTADSSQQKLKSDAASSWRVAAEELGTFLAAHETSEERLVRQAQELALVSSLETELAEARRKKRSLEREVASLRDGLSASKLDQERAELQLAAAIRGDLDALKGLDQERRRASRLERELNALRRELAAAERLAEQLRSRSTPPPTQAPTALRDRKGVPLRLLGPNRFGAVEYLHEQTGLLLIHIPGGEFTMGLDDGAVESRPSRSVRMSPYLIGKFEVTNAAFERFCEATKRPFPNPAPWKKGGKPEDWARRPVVNVSFDDVNDFLDWAGLELPSEAQWELAARGLGAGRMHPWGKDPVTPELAVFGRRFEAGPASAKALGSIRSPWGAQHLLGNVWEWTADRYAEGYAGQSRVDPRGPGQGDLRVTRGGAWFSPPSMISSTRRVGQRPDAPLPGLGFRASLSL